LLLAFCGVSLILKTTLFAQPTDGVRSKAVATLPMPSVPKFPPKPPEARPHTIPEKLSLDEAKALFDVNFFGTLNVCRTVLPGMRQQGGGYIINVGSIGGLIAIPYQAMYSASKFALEGFTEALRLEARQWNPLRRSPLSHQS